MYAIINCGNKQYRVQPNDKLKVEKLKAKEGDIVEVEDIYLVSTGNEIIIEPSALKSARVLLEVLKHYKDKKIRVFKYKRRKNYHRTYGHRQWYTEVLVKEIKLN
ncbi:MAG: 50S ribosomal protein L21 [Candidatus Hydrogenedentes bacterium]|nr:50S ribosomal protein L21 [Candidatus Hydrogenedentota bacterium]